MKRRLLEHKQSQKYKRKEKSGGTAADYQLRVEELWLKRMSCDLELNLFVWGTTMSYSFFLPFTQIKGLAS